MSCPQGLTLSGKMCTIAPTLSCPSGYTLVNGMCQEDDGLQGFGDVSMNIPPSDNMRLAPGNLNGGREVSTSTAAVAASPMMMQTQQQQRFGNVLSQVGGMLTANIPELPGQPSVADIERARAMMMARQNSPRPPTVPQIQSISSSPAMPVRPLSPQRPPPISPPMTMTPPPPPPMMPMGGGGGSPNSQCPTGYSLNRADGMCYPL